MKGIYTTPVSETNWLNDWELDIDGVSTPDIGFGNND